jgi:hypothetical protein
LICIKYIVAEYQVYCCHTSSILSKMSIVIPKLNVIINDRKEKFVDDIYNYLECISFPGRTFGENGYISTKLQFIGFDRSRSYGNQRISVTMYLNIYWNMQPFDCQSLLLNFRDISLPDFMSNLMAELSAITGYNLVEYEVERDISLFIFPKFVMNKKVGELNTPFRNHVDSNIILTENGTIVLLPKHSTVDKHFYSTICTSKHQYLTNVDPTTEINKFLSVIDKSKITKCNCDHKLKELEKIIDDI